MTNDWSNKEKIALLSDILEYGDQPESWSAISNDLSRTFQSRKDGRFSIKNCRHEYKSLVDQYKSQWIQHGSNHGLKTPLAKFIWIQLKAIYQAELTDQLKENRRKLTEIYLQLETTIHIKPNVNESIPTNSLVDVSTPLDNSQQNEEEKTLTTETISHSTSENPSTILNENTTILSENSSKETQPISDHVAIKEENPNEIHPPSIQSNMEIDHSLLDNSSHNPSSSDQILESNSSSRTNSRTSSETKIDTIKNISATNSTATSKYHVYFSPKNSITPTQLNVSSTKIKPKRKINDEIKDESEHDNQQSDILSSSTTTEQSKNSSTAPITRRSINTRSVPNTAAEQEEEKSRRFSAMLSENPNSWQSQSMAIIQFLLAQRQGYLFEHEITDEIAPKYHKFVRRPIALDTIRKNLESNVYSSKEYFRRDIYLMLYNAMKYNPRHHHVHRSARHLFNTTLPLFDLLPAEIQAQISTKTNVVTPTSANENPLVKRQRIK